MNIFLSPESWTADQLTQLFSSVSVFCIYLQFSIIISLSFPLAWFVWLPLTCTLVACTSCKPVKSINVGCNRHGCYFLMNLMIHIVIFFQILLLLFIISIFWRCRELMNGLFIGVHPFRHFFRHFQFWRFRHPYKTLGPPLYLKSSRFLKNLSVSALIFSVSAPIVSPAWFARCVCQPLTSLVVLTYIMLEWM